MNWKNLNTLTANQLARMLQRDDVWCDPGTFDNVNNYFVPGNPIVRNRMYFPSETQAGDADSIGIDLMSEEGNESYTAGVIILKSLTKQMLREKSDLLQLTATMIGCEFARGDHPSWRSICSVPFSVIKPVVLFYLIGNCFRRRPESYAEIPA